MSPLQNKPIIHGRDHRTGGPDPIPGMGTGGGIMFDTYPQDGNWLYVETTDATGAGGSPNGQGIELVSADDFYLETNTTLGIFATNGQFSFSGTSGPVLTVHTNNGGQEYVAEEDITFQSYLFSIDNTAFGVGNGVQLRGDSILVSTVGQPTGAITINSENNLILQSDTLDVQVIAGVGQFYAQAAQITFNSTGGQQVTCTTLAHVIALLQAYGLAL